MDSQTLQALFSVPVRARVRTIEDRHIDALRPDERAQIARAVGKRQREYATARVLFRELMEELGREPCSLVNGPDRAPIWPEGLTGSITHTGSWCGVVLGDPTRCGTVGIDMEQGGPLKADLTRMIFTGNETDFVRDLALAKLGFSAKEAAYKAQYPQSRELLNFSDLELSREDSHLIATFQRDAGPFQKGMQLAGTYVVTPELVVTAFCVPTRSPIL